MTAPLNPSKAKTYVALAGSLLTAAVPLILEVSTYLPAQWSATIGAVIALLTALGVYHAPYLAPGTTVAAAPDNPAPAVAPPPGGWRNPWRPRN